MLGQIYEKAEHNEIAARYYSRIVKDYPLSDLAGDAKNKLVKFGVPVPPADPTAIARMQKEQQADRPGMLKRSMTVLKTRPDVSSASHSGAPTLTPASETGDETLTLNPQVGSSLAGGGSTGATTGAGNNAAVEMVTPGATSSTDQSASDATPAATDSSTTPAAATATDSSTTQPAAATATPAAPADKSQESTSKKKKGLARLNPF